MAEFVTKAENKRRLAIIILCAIVNVGALTIGGIGMKKGSDIEHGQENKGNILNLKKDLAEKREALKALQDNYLTYAKDIGWRFEAVGTTDRFSTSPLQSEVLKNYLSDLVKYRPDQQAKMGKSVFETFGIAKYKRWDDPGAGENLVLTRVFEELLAKENEYKTKIEDLKTSIERERTAEVAVLKSTETNNAEKMGQIDGKAAPNAAAGGLIGELIRLHQDLNKTQKSDSEDLAKTEEETIAKQNEATTVKNDNVRKRGASAVIKEDFKRRIYVIQHHREEAKERRDPDGEILSINENRQLAYINLLRKDRLFKGTKFQVYSLEKGGQKLDKGTVEVIEVRESLSSICSIVTTADPAWPLKPGDKIYNELYEGGRTRYVAFAGRFVGKLSNEAAAYALRKFGDVYQDKVDENTNYVVVADGYEEHPNYKAALEYGIKILRENILLDYLGIRRD
ncbi:MAG TPA: hypothetical protein VMU54_11730 [Planctomycetota bacterium]|nr:hypothetical protein [Planctomycetota bacterium]